MKRLILLAAIGIILLGASALTFAQPGSGRLYGTRDPHTCPDRTLPKGNTVTADKAKEYFLCDMEDHSISNMNLFDEVTVQVGTPRRYNQREDINVWNIDVSVPVNPIRGISNRRLSFHSKHPRHPVQR